MYGSFGLADKLYLQTELLYSQHYNIIKNSGKDWVSLREAKVDNLVVPILVQYEIIHGLRLEAGPQVGFPIYSHERLDGGLDNIIECMRVVDVGLAGGVKSDRQL